MGTSYTSLGTHDTQEILLNARASTPIDRRPTMRTRHASCDNTNYKCELKSPPVHSDTVTALTSVRPGMVISGGRDKLIALNNIDSGECVMRWKGHEREITKLHYRNTGGQHFLLSGSRDTTIKLWKFSSELALQTFSEHTMSVMGLEILQDMKFCSGARDNTLKIWDINSGKSILTKTMTRNLVTHLSRSPTDNIIAQSSEDKELKLWDSRNLELIHQYPKKRHIQTHCSMLPDGLYCLSSSNGFNGDGCEITLWDIRQRKLLREYRGHEESVNCAIFLPQQITWKRLILSVSTDQCARIWNLDDGNTLWSEYIGSGGDLLSCVGFNDGNIIVCGHNSCFAHLRLMGRAGRVFLRAISMQVAQQKQLPTATTVQQSISCYKF